MYIYIYMKHYIYTNKQTKNSQARTCLFPKCTIIST